MLMPSSPPIAKRRIFDGGFLIIFSLTVAGGIAVALTRGAGRVAEIAMETFAFIGLLSPKIVAGVIVAAALPRLIPRDRILSAIGPESGLRGLVLATLAGALMPGGPSVAFAMAVGFMAGGADRGAALAYITSWSLLSLNRTLIWELSFVPGELVLIRVLLSLPAPIIVGWLARRLFHRSEAPV